MWIYREVLTTVERVQQDVGNEEGSKSMDK